jgi:hypothetical protein
MFFAMGRFACLGWPVVCAMLLMPSQAPAQSTSAAAVVIQTTVDGNTIIGFLHPSLASDGAVISSCTYPQAGCATFNASMCDPSYVGLPIELNIQRGSAGSSPANVKAYYWLQPNNTACSNDPLDSNAIWPLTVPGTVTGLLPTSSFVGGTQALTIPNDFTPLTVPFDTKTIMQIAFPGACQGAGISYTRWRICLGIDSDNNGVINPISGGTTDVTGYFEFLVDTALPASPNIVSTTSLYKRVEVDLTYDTGFESLYGLVVRSTDDPANIALGDCNSWNSHVNEQVVQVGYGGTGSGELTIEVSGTNGSRYAYCAGVIDVVGNLFDCYPSDSPDGAFQTGFGTCTTGLTPTWWMALVFVWLTVRWRRRRHFWNAGSAPIR